MEGTSGDLKAGNNISIPDNQANDELQTSICRCSSLHIRGEIEEVVKRGIQTIEEAVKRGIQTIEEAAKREIQTIRPPLVEEAVLKRIQASIPTLVEEMRRVYDTSLPLMQSSNRPSNSRQSPHMEVSQASRTLHLQFQCLRRPLTRIFTCKSLREQEISLQVVLKDDSGNIVEAGAESSMKIKIVALNGDFSLEDGDDFTGNRFHENVPQQRDNKPPLLAGKCELALNKGVAAVDDIKFTDNSSWTRNGKFKLGVEAVKGVSNGVTVRIGTSEAFKVKELRGESYQKKDTPGLNDEVWRLKHIAKNGPIRRRLQDNDINSVNDLLRMHHANADSLKKILRVSDTKFQNIIERANSALPAHANSIQPGYYIGSNGGKDAMPLAYEISNELPSICGLNYHSSLPNDNYLPAFGSSANTLLDIAAANSDNSEMQLSMLWQPQDAMHMFPDLPTEHLFLTADNLGRVQEIENDLRACTSNTLPTRGLYRRRWRRLGAALRFSVFRIAINRQPCKARKKQKYY